MLTIFHLFIGHLYFFPEISIQVCWSFLIGLLVFCCQAFGAYGIFCISAFNPMYNFSYSISLHRLSFYHVGYFLCCTACCFYSTQSHLSPFGYACCAFVAMSITMSWSVFFCVLPVALFFRVAYLSLQCTLNWFFFGNLWELGSIFIFLYMDI